MIISYTDFMETLKIFGGNTLNGEIEVDGSKNSFLPIMAASVLCDGEIVLKRYPNLSDLIIMREILGTLNISTHVDGKTLYIDSRNSENKKITHDLTQKVRASIFILGALLGKFRSAVIAYPGGCNIGERPIDIHLKSFRTLGCRIIERHGYIYCYGENMKAGEVVLDFPSVGATESLLMCACVLEGETIIRNPAKEPEIVDLQEFINSMGGNVKGAGTDKIVINGVKSLHGTTFSVMYDRIVAGTYLLATATCGGHVLVKGVDSRHNSSLLAYLRQTACQIDVFNDKIELKADKRLSSIKRVTTMPYPFFPTDLQAPMMTLQSVSQGVCFLEETIFENRFGHVFELKKMGADIITKNRIAMIRGVDRLFGADVTATDLRAGAALVMAGMKAEGYTTIHNVDLIDRGYEKIEEKYALLGADIKRITI